MQTDPKANRRQLATTIRWLVAVHQSVATRPTSVEFVVAALRDRGQAAEAVQLERIAAGIRARRATAAT
jgi:hypothetical protein